VHTDLAGPVEPISREGFWYAIVFTDNYSGAMFVYFLKNKVRLWRPLKDFWQILLPLGKLNV